MLYHVIPRQDRTDNWKRYRNRAGHCQKIRRKRSRGNHSWEKSRAIRRDGQDAQRNYRKNRQQGIR